MYHIYMNNSILIIEGCDASGKSTLAQQIMEKYPNHMYIHNAVTDDIYALHRNTIDAAVVASKHHTVIIDRLHLSEQIYGTIYRDGPSYDTCKFDNMLNSIPNVKKILCIVDKETCLAKHAGRKDKEMFDDVSKVWDMYNSVNDETWIKYNWKKDTIDLETFNVTHT